jgi:protein kinase D
VSLLSQNILIQNVDVAVSEGAISDEPEERITDMSQLYQIFADEVLGSGQFGIVYGGG